jgi:hypothetical protein
MVVQVAVAQKVIVVDQQALQVKVLLAVLESLVVLVVAVVLA